MQVRGLLDALRVTVRGGRPDACAQPLPVMVEALGQHMPRLLVSRVGPWR
jgi:hypothetical protein